LRGNPQRVGYLARRCVQVCFKRMRQHLVQTDVGRSSWPFAIGEVFATPATQKYTCVFSTALSA
jgi:hypothetical protein